MAEKGIVEAPFTKDEVLLLWRWQNSGQVHPFTCPNRHDHPALFADKGVLIPSVTGWFCMFCDYRQNWCHDFMVGKRNG